MKHFKSILFVSVIFLLSNLSCQKEGISLDGDTDYLIFGSSYGECAGDCSITYLLKTDGLYKSKEYLKTGKLNSFTEKLSDKKFNMIKGLEQKIPTEFLKESENEKSYGCPDCHDQGAYFLEIARIGHQNKRFIMDTQTDRLPGYAINIAAGIKTSIEIVRK